MKIIFYGATWCPDCRRSKKFLDERKVDYTYINLEETPDTAAEVEKINKGMLYPSTKLNNSCIPSLNGI